MYKNTDPFLITGLRALITYMRYYKNMNNYQKLKNKRRILTLIIFALILFIYLYGKGRQRAVAGISDPVQTEASGETYLSVGGYDMTVQFLYEYEIEALVVSTHNAHDGTGAKLAPRDIVLCWGSVAALNETIDFHWNQSGRFYSWHVDTYDEVNAAGGVQGVNEHSSNNHLVPADSRIRRQINSIKTGDHIRLKGYLINIDGTASNGSTFYWYSSTTRSDTGNHSCELIYVTEVEWLP